MANEQDKALEKYADLVQFMASSLLEDDVKVEVRSKTNRDQWRIELLVPKEHRGRVIGRGGRIARAMRAMLDNAAFANTNPVVLDIVD